MPSTERVIAVGLLTQRDIGLLGPSFERLWPVDETPCFGGLIRAIDEADSALRKDRSGPRVDIVRNRIP